MSDLIWMIILIVELVLLGILLGSILQLRRLRIGQMIWKRDTRKWLWW